MVLKKAEIEASLLEEHQLIQDGKLKEDSPLDNSENFVRLCEACRRGDLKTCQEMITEGANINARDKFDYTPLILVCQISGNPFTFIILANASRQGESLRSL